MSTHRPYDRYDQPTPGPWFLLSGPTGKGLISNTVGKDWGAKAHFVAEADMANARLIAQAPAMLEALQEIARGWPEEQRGQAQTVAKNLLAQIEKG